MSKMFSIEHLDDGANLSQKKTSPLDPGMYIPIDESELLPMEKLDLNSELAKNYQRALHFQKSLLINDTAPANQIAQVINTVTAITKEIIRQQSELHNVNKYRRMEEILVGALKEAPRDVQDAVLAKFEALTLELRNERSAA